MKSEVESIVNKALNLAPNARAYIAEVLLESLDFEEDFPITEEWMDEIQKRCHEIDHGEIKLISGEDALLHLHQKYL